MKNIKIILIAVLFALMQVSIAPYLSIWGAGLNLTLIFLIIMMLNFRFEDSLIYAGIAGMILDIYSPMRFGIYLFSFLLIYFLGYYIFKKIVSEQIFISVVLSFFISYMIVEFMAYMLNDGSLWIWMLSAGYTAIAGTVIYYISLGSFKSQHKGYKLFDK
jgi:rod shape-determining protein MreD